MKTSASNRRLRILLTSIGNETLLPQPEFQRRLVWSNKDKIEFIKTVLEGYPFPEIYIASGALDPKTGEGCELLVDGQQRITTLYQYFKNSHDLKLPKEIVPYSELEEEQQINFLEYEVVVRDLGKKPLTEVKEIFQRINSTSYGLNAMEIHNARYGGEFKIFAEEFSQKEIFEDKKIFTSTDIKRMNDVRYCLGVIVTIMTSYFNRDKEVELYLEKYNEIFDQKDKYQTELDEIIELINDIDLPKGSRAFKKADFFTLFVELHKAKYKLDKNIDIPTTKSNILDFYKTIESVVNGTSTDDGAEKYYSSALQASNDRSSRICRGELIQKLIIRITSN